MHKLLVKGAFLLALFTFGLQVNSLSAQEDICPVVPAYSTGKTYNNFFYFDRLIVTPVFVCDNSAVSLLAEFGPKHYRINGSWGGFFCGNQRLKIGAEYLQQKYHYKFVTGEIQRWNSQWAVGGKYQYLFNDCCNPCACNPCECNPCECNPCDCCSCCCDWIQGVQIVAGVSNAHKHKLHRIFPQDPPAVSRNLSSSWFANGEVGMIIRPWECSSLIVGVGYDYVRYNRNVQGVDVTKHDHKNVSGFGGSLEFDQKFCCNYGFHVLAQFYRPYNYLEGLLTWTQRRACGDLIVGLFGSHTWGKCHLASSSAVGFELGFAFGIDNCCNLVWCDPCSCPSDCCCYSELSDWVAAPAVYMPEVLSIPDTFVQCLD